MKRSAFRNVLFGLPRTARESDLFDLIIPRSNFFYLQDQSPGQTLVYQGVRYNSSETVDLKSGEQNRRLTSKIFYREDWEISRTLLSR